MEAAKAARHLDVSIGKILGALPVVVWLLASSAQLARAAADAGASTADAGATPAYAVELQRQAEHVRAFLKGELDPELEPQSLFDVALDASDERLQVEQRRVRTVLARESAAPEAAQSSGPLLERAARAALANAAELDERVWRAQLQVERARLPFYALPSSERAKLVRRHAERRERAKSLDHEQALGAAERAAREALTREHEALEAARLASTEAARLINEEYARLLAVTRQQAELETSLIQRRAALDARNEVTLGWKRRVADVTTSARLGAEARAQADSTYVALRVTLHEARNLLSSALGDAGNVAQLVPRAGPDPLVDLPADADPSMAFQQRRAVLDRERELEAAAKDLEATEARQLMTEVEVLNRLRLELLGALSAQKRESVLDFGPSGWDQAAAEVRQVMLTLRYHVHAAFAWLNAVRSGAQRGQSAWLALVLALTWAFPVALLVWWRRRAEATFEALGQRKREAARTRHAGDWFATGKAERIVAFARRVRRPLEWLLLVGAVTWLMPDELKGLLEARLASTVLLWIFGGHFIVLAIDALSSQRALQGPRSGSIHDTESLRLRSLGLVGRSVVAFGLLLSLSDLLVGQGTIYGWVFSTCWFVAIPLLLVIVAWWRPLIFERFSRMRKPNGFETWVLSRRGAPPNVIASITSSIAAVTGGVYLFVLGAVRVVRGRVLAFQLTRRLLAYLFRRDLSKKARDESAPGYASLAGEVFRALGPEVTSDEPVRSVADDQVDDVIRRIKAAGGGAIAIVGERGAGKSMLMARILKSSPSVISVVCTSTGLPGLRHQLNEQLGLGATASLEEAVATIDGRLGDHALLIDDSQFLIRPVMGGFAELDRVLSLFRSHSKNCTWILAFDAVIWRFIERARSIR